MIWKFPFFIWRKDFPLAIIGVLHRAVGVVVYPDVAAMLGVGVGVHGQAVLGPTAVSRSPVLSQTLRRGLHPPQCAEAEQVYPACN